MFGIKKTAANNKIDKSTEQVLELEAQKKRLEMEREQISLELQNIKQRQEMNIEKEKHKHSLALASEKAVFEREKEIWAKEKAELLDRAEREKSEFEATLAQKFELKTQEAVTLTKLEAQQLVKQAELDKERAISELRAEQAEEISALEATKSEEYYKKLTEAFADIQMNGDKNSKFVQELTLQMLNKMPTPQIGVGVSVDSKSDVIESK